MSAARPAGSIDRSTLSRIGPGIALAATGVGAGDLVAAAVAGSRFGFALVWAAVVGAILKYSLSEGIARWQLATGTTLLEGWTARMGNWVRFVFFAYLVVWSFVVAGALMSACGVAAHALFPVLSVRAWGGLHSLAAALLVLAGGYVTFERAIKVVIGLMFVALVGSAASVASPARSFVSAVRDASIPLDGAVFALSVIGGVGGSVTLLAYGYWIRERGWEGDSWRPTVRVDLGVAYLFTGIFGVAVIGLAAVVLHPAGVVVGGRDGVLQMAGLLEGPLGAAGRWTFLVGFWAAVATSMLGVWQGIPYLFCDFVALSRDLPPRDRRRIVRRDSPWYRGSLLWLAVPPMVLLTFDRPFGVIVVYTVLGALFMPFLAATLLVMNSNASWVGERSTNSLPQRILLGACVALFGVLAVVEIVNLAW